MDSELFEINRHHDFVSGLAFVQLRDHNGFVRRVSGFISQRNVIKLSSLKLGDTGNHR
jgi:hypothetical protein